MQALRCCCSRGWRRTVPIPAPVWRARCSDEHSPEKALQSEVVETALGGLGGAGAAVLLLGGLAKASTHSRSTAESPLLRLALLLSATGSCACARGHMPHQRLLQHLDSFLMRYLCTQCSRAGKPHDGSEL